MQIRAIDDAGAKSAEPARVRVTSNFDPETVIDRTTLVATLPRPWKSPPDTLRIGPGVAPGDTLPLGATLYVQWESSDVDGPVRAFQPKFGDINVRQLDTLRTQGLLAFGEVNTDTTGVSGSQRLGQTDRTPRGAPFFVKGIDVYNNVEQRPDTLYLHVNFRPRVAFADTLPDPFLAKADGTPYTFPFAGSDADADSLSLRYRWRFEKVTGSPKFEETDLLDLARDEWYAFKTNNFSPSDTGDWLLFVWSQDASGSIRESEADTLLIRVVP